MIRTKEDTLGSSPLPLTNEVRQNEHDANRRDDRPSGARVLLPLSSPRASSSRARGSREERGRTDTFWGHRKMATHLALPMSQNTVISIKVGN